MLHVVRWSPSGLSHGAVIRRLAILLIGTSVVGCSLKPADQGSRISLVLPNPQSYGLREVGSSSRMGIAPTAWNSTDFKCYGVNIVGAGIADSSKNPDPAGQDISALLSGSKSCAYKGITSPGFVFSAGSTDVVIDLQVPAGPGRVIQLVGITNADHCGANFLTGAAAGSPGAYEIGHRVVDLFGDTTVSIPVTYAQTEDRRVDCGGGSVATVVSVSLDSAGTANSYVNTANQSAVQVSGTCSVTGATVDVKVGGVSQTTATCSVGGTWSATLNFSNGATFPEGVITLAADLTNNGVAAPTATRVVTKDITAPSVTSVVVNSGAVFTNTLSVSLALSATGATVMKVANDSGLTGGASEAYAVTKAWTLGTANATNTVYVGFADAAGNEVVINDSILHDSTPPGASSSLAWSSGAITNSPSIQAIWAKSASPDLANQKIQFFSDTSCAVVSGSLIDLASSTVQTRAFTAPGDGTYAFKVHSFDSAGLSTPSACSPSATVDTTAPTVAITTPAAGSFVNIANQSSFAVSGTCSENGRAVVISGSASASVTCTTGAWTANLDFSAAANGAVSIAANHSDLAGNAATQFSRNFSKDSVAPTASITNPTVNAEVGYPNLTSFSAHGTCSENGAIVSYSGPAAGSVTCTSGAWAVGIDLTGVSVGAHVFSITHLDGAGNPATVPSVNFYRVGQPTQLVFGLVSAQAPAATHIDACYGPLDIIAQDIFNRESATSAAITVTLNGGGAFNFYTDSECRTTAATGTSITVATSRQTIFYRAMQITGATIQASAGGLTAASRNLSVLGFTATAPVGAASTVGGSREDHSTLWTGTEMIIWGGFQSSLVKNTGERFNGTSSTATTTTGAPAARKDHTAVWTSAQMLIWGGMNGSAMSLDSGGRYATGTDSWTAMTTTGAPTARYGHSAVWTGTEMIIWGGYDGTAWPANGGQYAPADTWSAVGTGGAVPAGRTNHAAVWTGSEMLIWGGSNGGGTLNTGARYDRGTGNWMTMAAPPAGFAGREHFAYAWSGTELFIFGGMSGSNALSDGARYNPSTNSWALLPKEGAPRLRGYASGAWGNGKFLVAGGMIPTSTEYLRYSGGFDPATAQWQAVEIFNGSPAGAKRPSLIHAGTGFWIFGGTGNASSSLFNLPNF